MRVRLQRTLAHALQVFAEGRIARQVAAQHQRVDKKADQAFELRPPTACNRSTHRDILLPRVAIEQDMERGEEGHEQRRPLALGELLERASAQRVDLEAHPSATVARHRRARAVRWQLEDREIRERGAPIRDLPLENFALQPFALPRGEVGVLHRQLRKRRRFATAKCSIEHAHLARQHRSGPGVADDVMHGEQQPVLARRQAKQSRTKDRAAVEAEFALRFLGGSAPSFALALRRSQRAKIFQRQWNRDLGHRLLHRFACDHHEARAQYFVPAKELVQRPS